MLIKELGGLGYLGLLLIAFVSNAVPFSTVPYLVFLAPILAKQHGMEQIYAILVLALGASLGKLIVYVIARSISKIGRVSRSIHNLVNFTHMFKKATFLTVFLVAALPIPDDVFYIPIGISKYNIPLFFVALLLGKIVVTAITAIYGRAAAYILEGVMGLPPIMSIPSMIALSLIITWLLNKIDWNDAGKIYREKGLLKALTHILDFCFKVAVINPLVKFKSLFKKHLLRR